MDIISPLDFFKLLKWIDGKPLLDVIEPYRQKLFTKSLYTFNPEGHPAYDLVLAGRAKKNWKSADLIFAMLYRFLVWPSPQGNDSFLLANDEAQAGDDLKLAKKLIAANDIIDREVMVKAKEIERRDNGSILAILPAQDIAGSHGKTYLTIGYDEIHEYRDYNLLEALSSDPTRLDTLTWITSYNTIYNRAGIPLFDYIKRGRAGTDPKMYFSWYQADYTTDTAFSKAEPELRANPSMKSWGNTGYLKSQQQRLPSHKYRRLHLNLPGMPQGAYLNAEKVMNCVVKGRRRLKFNPEHKYSGFVDMSGGSQDDAVLSISHKDGNTLVQDLIISQNGKCPFDPRMAIEKFAKVLKEYGITSIEGDAYAGQTFRQDFRKLGIMYTVCPVSKHKLYEDLEVDINAQEIEILDEPKLYEQILGLVIKGTKIDHQLGEHDDYANGLAGLTRKHKGTVPRISMVNTTSTPARDPQKKVERPELLEGESIIEVWEGDKIIDFEVIRPQPKHWLPLHGDGNGDPPWFY